MSLLPQFLCLYFIWKGIQASSGYSGYKLGGGIAAGFSGIHVLVQCPGVLSSPEPSSFSDQNLSVVRRRFRRRRRCCCSKLFTFSSSSQEPLDQI